MTNRELAEALRLCGNHKIGEDECHRRCPFSTDEDAVPLCVEVLAAACADALANSETHIAALQREIEKLRAQLEMERKPQWVSVKERLPEPEVRVLCYCTDRKERVLCCDHLMDDWDFAAIDGHGYALSRTAVTHWMPLPSTEGVE